MIPRAYITEWRAAAPWSEDSQVEQDLILSRALVTMFGASEVAKRLAFRGERRSTNSISTHRPAIPKTSTWSRFAPNPSAIRSISSAVSSILGSERRNEDSPGMESPSRTDFRPKTSLR